MNINSRVLILIFLLLIGCKSIKKNKKSSKSEEEIKTEQVITEKNNQEIITTDSRTIDSNIKEVVISGVKIYPKGEFTIGKDGDFKGVADSVVTVNKKLSERLISENDTSVTKENNTSEKDEKITSDSTKKSEDESLSVTKDPSIIPWIGSAVALIIIAVVYSVYKKITR